MKDERLIMFSRVPLFLLLLVTAIALFAIPRLSESPYVHLAFAAFGTVGVLLFLQVIFAPHASFTRRFMGSKIVDRAHRSRWLSERRGWVWIALLYSIWVLAEATLGISQLAGYSLSSSVSEMVTDVSGLCLLVGFLALVTKEWREV